MNNDIENLNSLIMSLQPDTINKLEKFNNEKDEILHGTAFVLTALSFALPFASYFGYIFSYGTSSLVSSLTIFFGSLIMSKGIMMGLYKLFYFKSKELIKEDSLNKINKKYIFDFFLALDRVSMLLKKDEQNQKYITQIITLKSNIQDAMVNDNYQKDVLKHIVIFYLHSLIHINKKLNLETNRLLINKEYEQYKQNNGQENYLEMNTGNKSAFFKTSL